MKIKCKANRAGDVFSDSELPFGTSKDSRLGVDVGVIYTVAGMHLWKGQISFFVFNGSYPELCPNQFFEVVDSKISKNWHFRQIAKNESLNSDAIWGYYEFCFDESHYEKIVDYDEDALELFSQKLKEMTDEE